MELKQFIITCSLFIASLLIVDLSAAAVTQQITQSYRIRIPGRAAVLTLREGTGLLCNQNDCRFRLSGSDTTYRIPKNRLRLTRGSATRYTSSMRTVTNSVATTNRTRVETSARGTQRNEITFASPTCSCEYGSCRVSSDFGPRTRPNGAASSYHEGMDIAGGAGTPIVAAEAGMITHAGRMGNYGITIDIQHSSTYKTRYGHMSRMERTSGFVQQGEVIGYMGSTGNVTGPHLHFEVFRNGDQVNPAQYVGQRRSTFSEACSVVRSAGRAEAIAEGAVL